MQAGPQRRVQSRFGGIKCQATRDPILEEGGYRVRILGATISQNPRKNHRETSKITLLVEDATAGSKTQVGAQVSMLFVLSSLGSGFSDLKSLHVAALGYGPSFAERATMTENLAVALDAAEAAYDAADQPYSGATIDATHGIASGAPQSIIGRSVEILVTRGKDIESPQTGQPTGDYFRNYAFGPVK